MKTFQAKVSKFSQEKISLGEVLFLMTKMNEDILSDAALKGAVWVQRGKKTLRDRFLKSLLAPADTVKFFFDPRVLALPTLSEAPCLYEDKNYGIWFKAAGVVAQGTQVSDHSSLLRLVERTRKGEVHLVHRIDRETAGLMIFAYHSQAAARLGDLFQKNLIYKEYQAVVLGSLAVGEIKSIDVSLDDKHALTHYEVLLSDGKTSLLKVKIETGRLHQIRRHLDHIGHPVIGDPKYGRGNKNRQGLKLLAKTLAFVDPWDKEEKSWTWPETLSL